MLLIAFDSYFALPLIRFFRENESKMEQEKKKGELISQVFKDGEVGVILVSVSEGRGWFIFAIRPLPTLFLALSLLGFVLFQFSFHFRFISFVACSFLFFIVILPSCPAYLYYLLLSQETGVAVSSAPPYLAIFKRIWVQALSVWFVFFVTLTNFPAIQLKVVIQENSVMSSQKIASLRHCVCLLTLLNIDGIPTNNYFCRTSPEIISPILRRFWLLTSWPS